MTRVARWAVVGSSSFVSTAVLPALLAAENAEPVAVVSRRPELVDLPATFGSVATVGKLRDLVRLGVDVVHLVVPNDVHASLALAALDLGLHVVVEKPFALSADQGQALVAAAAAADRRVAVGSCMAWSPVVTRAQEILSSGQVGRIRHATLSVGFDVGGERGWRQTTTSEGGGGVLFDLGSHGIDTLLRLLGPISRVTATLDTSLPGCVADDTAALVIDHEGGATSFMHVAFTHGCNGLSIVGDEGELVSREWLGRNFRGDLTLRSGSSDARRFDRRKSSEVDVLAGAGVVDVVAMQAEEVSHAVLFGGQAPRASPDTGIRVLEVIEAARLSSLVGRAVDV